MIRGLSLLALVTLIACSSDEPSPVPSPTPGAPGRFVYVASVSPGAIRSYRIATDGTPTPVGEVAFDGTGSPNGLVLDVRGGWLWAPVAGGRGGIRAFAIDRASGMLRELTGSPLDIDREPDTLVAAPTGAFLFAVRFAHPGVQTLAVEASGSLVPVTGGSIATPASVSAAPFPHPSGRFLHVCFIEPEGIGTYLVNTVNGILTPMGPLSAVPAWPFSITEDPSGRFVYVTTNASNFSQDTLVLYSIDPGSGSLARVPGSAFDPVFDLYLADISPARVTFDPTGARAYVADRPGRTGARSRGYWVFPVQSSGRLGPTRLGPFTTEGGDPVALALDPAGRFAYVIDQFAARLQAFALDPATGALSPRGAPVPTGSLPTTLVVGS